MIYKIRPRHDTIICIDHPEWGTFAVDEDNGDYYEIRNRSGGRILSKDEFARFWKVSEKGGYHFCKNNIQGCINCDFIGHCNDKNNRYQAEGNSNYCINRTFAGDESLNEYISSQY